MTVVEKRDTLKCVATVGVKLAKDNLHLTRLLPRRLRTILWGLTSYHLRAMAGLMLTMAYVNKAVMESKHVKVPHMLYEQLQWVNKCPPRHPTCTLSVTVSVKGYQKNNYIPPPGTRRRNTDMTALSDSGCQACCMGLTQLHALGLTRRDLLQPLLSLKAANTSGINIVGVVFLMITGWDRYGNKWRTQSSLIPKRRLSCHANKIL